MALGILQCRGSAIMMVHLGIKPQPNKIETLMTQRRRNRKNFAPLGQVLDKVVHQYRPQADHALIQVWDVWQAAVGDIIADNAQPAAFKRDILLIHVSSSTWLHHLRFMEKELIAKINHSLGAKRVRALTFKIGPC